MNAVKPARVTPTPTAPTLLVHMFATVPLVFMEMLHIAKVNITCYQFLPLPLSKANYLNLMNTSISFQFRHFMQALTFVFLQFPYK